ncbi:hypothetical protein EV1_009631 [Malus domestica]
MRIRLGPGHDSVGERDLEKGLVQPSTPGALSEPPSSPHPSRPALVFSNSSKALLVSNSGKALLVSNSSKSLVASNSGKRIDQLGRKKYVKQVTGRHNDTELHLAARRGDLAAVHQFLGEIDAQMVGSEFDEEVEEMRSAIVNEVNELGETALFIAAEQGHLAIVEELLPYMTEKGILLKNQIGFDALHIAANKGHQAVVQVLLDHDPGLSKTVGQANATPLVSAATRGHTAVVRELLSKDSTLLEVAKSNGKNALHLAARQGHVEIVKTLLGRDPQLARRIDKKGQTALHMAVKGHSSEVVRLIVNADPAIVMLPDKFGNSALHVATRKKRVDIVNVLLLVRDTNVNALTRDQKTPLDIAEGLPYSEEITTIKETLTQYGAFRANELNQPRDELRNTVTEIQKNVHNQLEQARKTNQSVTGIAKELRKLQREGINNATNSVTVVASLFATVAFAALFTLPGGDFDTGAAVVSIRVSFKIFILSNAVSLFSSLAVVLVQITLVRGETKTERRVVEVINKLMWLASVCTTVAFISSSYIVVGRHNLWAAILVTVIGGLTIGGVIGTMTYYVVKTKRLRRLRKREKMLRRNGTNHSMRHSESDSEVNRIYAL